MPLPPAVCVPVGGTTWWQGAPLERAWLRPITGHDEWIGAELGERASAAEWVSAMLGRCVLGLGDAPGDAEGVGADVAAALTVGDRETLLMHLRRITFGDRLMLVADCEHCHEPMDVEAGIGQLLAVVPPAVAAEHELGASRFRLPTGRDQEIVAGLALDDPDGAAAMLMAQCVLAGPRDDETLAAIAERMEALDPLAAITLHLACPACNAATAVALDAGDLLRRELLAGSAALEMSVHLLALHYHWTEQAIFDLPVSRRRRYVAVLADALSESIG